MSCVQHGCQCTSSHLNLTLLLWCAEVQQVAAEVVEVQQAASVYNTLGEGYIGGGDINMLKTSVMKVMNLFSSLFLPPF